jgi:hypothetical protein
MEDLLDISATSQQASKPPFGTFSQLKVLPEADLPAGFSEIPCRGFLGMGGKEGSQVDVNRLADVAPERRDHGPGIHMHSRVVGKPTPKSGELASISSDLTKCLHESRGALTSIGLGFIHGW